ncbi:MAG: virulence RhuM family protein [Bacteroidetes bacterium]|nr:virulence RhuM family protein [Bacteroidota bacterium]
MNVNNLELTEKTGKFDYQYHHMTSSTGEIIIYTKEDGHTQIDVQLQGETLWLSQKLIAELFEKDVNTVNDHIQNIYADQELAETATTTIFTTEQQEGKRKVKRKVRFYNLDLILSVGYRVNSRRGTAFRIWANQILKDYLIKGYAHNEKLLQEKQAQLDSLKKAVALITNVSNSLHHAN